MEDLAHLVSMSGSLALMVEAVMNSKTAASADTIRLLGTTETASTNFQAFKYWNGAKAKWTQHRANQSD